MTTPHQSGVPFVGERVFQNRGVCGQAFLLSPHHLLLRWAFALAPVYAWPKFTCGQNAFPKGTLAAQAILMAVIVWKMFGRNRKKQSQHSRFKLELTLETRATSYQQFLFSTGDVNWSYTACHFLLNRKPGLIGWWLSLLFFSSLKCFGMYATSSHKKGARPGCEFGGRARVIIIIISVTKAS